MGQNRCTGQKLITTYLSRDLVNELKAISIRRGESRDVMFTRELQPLDI